ncbi:ABC transporter ATP-binding protein [Kineosporia sp. J2-2]|uniref:ABC transporter ATP-binding protein n=1 Tax=Kineosporia corallincola TaxID=2835133 RepID=A0ABS5TT75_9ACTN|nr:ABC transporter ATP-binding protein [Kineosporia corallincola]MBT0773991.1 ABC transporter ATP-binding protein [Kineosporia corallincola]
MSALPVATGRQTWNGLRRSAARHRREVALAGCWTFLASTGIVALPMLLGRCVDDVRLGRSSSLPVMLVLTGLVAVLGAVVTALAQRATARLGALIAADVREQAMTGALGLEPVLLESAGSGDITARVTDDVETFVAAVPLITQASTALTTVLVAVGAVAGLDWRLAIAFAVVLPIYWFGLSRYLARAGALYASERRAAAERGQVLLESLEGRPTVTAYGMAALQADRIERASAQSLEVRLRTVGVSLWLSKSMNAAEAAGLSSILVTGFWLVRADLVTVGAVTAAALLFHRLFDPLGTLLGSFDEVQRAGAALARIVGVTLVPPRVRPQAPLPHGGVRVRLRGVRHSYDGVHDVVAGVDLDVPAGSSLAVVGTSGAGKSTLAGLLAGLFPATAGTLCLGDDHGQIAVGEVEPERLREWVAMVSQETHVFAGTLRDDLLLARPGTPDGDLWRALARVGAERWVAALPGGLDTLVGAGGHLLTPVQTQHLALARLVLRDPPLLVMDEATAEAGSAGARDLEQAALALLDNRTAVVVAHRLSQARACDRIAVMDGGRIVEIGSHAELLERGGRYAELWRAWSPQPARPLTP